MLRADHRSKKSSQSFLRNKSALERVRSKNAMEGGLHMRIAKLIFVGSIAASAALAAPVLAKDSPAQKTSDPSTSSSSSTSSPCHAYQQAPDGSWTPLPCEEVGSGGQTQHKSSAHNASEGGSPTKTR
jgi:hypothetical protein